MVGFGTTTASGVISSRLVWPKLDRELARLLIRSVGVTGGDASTAEGSCDLPLLVLSWRARARPLKAFARACSSVAGIVVAVLVALFPVKDCR